MTFLRNLMVAASVAGLSMAVAATADAACTRLAFSVNDYGKDGPTKDAKNLLDKYIAKWAADRKIKPYTVGPKEVTCELFLDVIVFDEYTCKAAATVCWNGPLPAGHQVDASAAPLVNKAKDANRASAPKASASAAAAPKAGAAPVSTGSVKAAPAAPKAAPAAPAAAAQPAKAAPAPAPAAQPAKAAPAPAPAAN